MEPYIKPYRITLHCSVTPNGENCDISKIDEWHRQRGFSCVGYHLVIQPDGVIQYGRPIDKTGAHVKGANLGNIGICMIGTDQFTVDQFVSLKEKIDTLYATYPTLESYALYCHNQGFAFPSTRLSGKTCPNMEINRILLWYWFDEWKVIESYIKDFSNNN